MAMRSPGRTPHECNARAVLATLRPNSWDVTGTHFPDSRYSIMRSRLRSTAAKKMSFRVAMLIASFGSLCGGLAHLRKRLRTELYCFAIALGNAHGHRIRYSPVYLTAKGRVCWFCYPCGRIHECKENAQRLSWRRCF